MRHRRPTAHTTADTAGQRPESQRGALDAYALLRPWLFHLDAEDAHRISFALADRLARLRPAGRPTPATPVRVMGLDFANRVGLAAGLDKNAEHLRALAQMGFGHIEVGTVTPRPQPGNPRPRLFRLPEARAIINRFGFNNAGLDALLANVRRARERGDFACVLGINLGKNKLTPNEQTLDDYVAGVLGAGPEADYLTINISSPNTAALRDLQGPEALAALLDGIAEARERLRARIGRRVPIALKIAPDLDDGDLARIAERVQAAGLDAIIATNTTLSRAGVEGLPHADEAGGLSGTPLAARAEAVLAALARIRRDTHTRFALIGVGGIDSADAATARRAAGADLIQLYTGLVYRGPKLAADCARALR